MTIEVWDAGDAADDPAQALWAGDTDPVEVSALGSLSRYGKSGPFRHTHCRPCPHKTACPYFFAIFSSLVFE